MSHPVVDLVAARLASGSAPRARTDQARLALVVEGGSSRAAYGGGMVLELERRGLLPALDAVYGCSAGALNGAWLVCGRVARSVHGWYDPAVTTSIIDPRRVLRGGAVVDTDRLVNEVYETVTPMGYDEILASPVEYHPLATDIETGASTDLAPLVHDRATLQAALRATTRMPVLGGPPVELGGRRFIDAGVSESVPVRMALSQGATHVMVLRTRAPRTAPHRAGRLERDGVSWWMRRHAPGAAAAWQRRPETSWAEEQLLASTPNLLQVHPPADAPRISRTNRHEATLRAAVATGAAQVAAALGPVGLARPQASYRARVASD